MLEECIKFFNGLAELTAEVEAQLTIANKKEDIYSLDGELNAKVVSGCDRCGNRAQFDICQSFAYRIHLDEEPQFESEHLCTDKDCELLYLLEPVIESDDILSEQLLLALPGHIYCSHDCKGLCNKCGINLNDGTCDCGEINENSPFAILKKIQQS